MKKLRPYTLLAVLALFSSCTLKEVVNPDGTIKTPSSSASGSGTGTGTGTGTTGGSITLPTGTSVIAGADSYLPLTKGSNWTYKLDNGDTITTTMTDEPLTLNSRTYVKFTEHGNYYDDPHFYFYGNNLFVLRTTNDPAGALEDIPILKDNAAVNATWITSTNAAALNVAARYLGTMKEKGITRTVNGKVYTDVYHTKIETQLGAGTTFATISSNDYYFAKGVGIIEMTETFGGSVSYKQTLISYSIK